MNFPLRFTLSTHFDHVSKGSGISFCHGKKEKGSDLFKVLASDSIASRLYVSLINQKSSVFFPISSVREGDTFHCMLAIPVLCTMSTISGIVP